MINKYTSLAAIEQHITPHMFRRTFASSLLDADVDIRYIQEMLGHSSINTTQISGVPYSLLYALKFVVESVEPR